MLRNQSRFTRTRSARIAPLATSAAVVVALLGALPAAANGPCGQNFDGNHACPVNTATTANYPGSLVTDNESDYYVFYASKGTELSVTITDTENPGCSTAYSAYCGSAEVTLDDAQGNAVDGAGSSRPNNGITVPQTFSHTLDTSGTYYLIVDGSLGSDAHNNPTDVPYTLGVSASPNVQWPPPPPPPAPCTVPSFKVGAGLSSVEQSIVAKHCTVGQVKYSYSKSVGRGGVLSLSPASGSHLSSGAAVNIEVSAGPPPPPCRVPYFQVGAKLASVERAIRAAHCSVGQVQPRRDRQVRRGRVVALSPRSGKKLASKAPVEIVISAGRKPHK